MIIGVTILVFFLMSLSPIDQAYSVLGENASEAQVIQYREEHGLNDPVLVQYGNFMVGLVQGDLGTYGANNASVTDRVAQALPIAAIATPSFWLAVLMILLFSSMLHVLPASGALPSFAQDPAGWLARMAMPAIALAIPVTGQLTRVIRTSMVEELDKDYVRTALGAGIPKSVVIGRNVLRNALITPVTVLGLRIGYLIGGAVVIEVIFNLPGMGMAILSGIQSNYTMLVQGVVLVVAVTFIIINIVVDMLYILIDPRIRTV